MIRMEIDHRLDSITALQKWPSRPAPAVSAEEEQRVQVRPHTVIILRTSTSYTTNASERVQPPGQYVQEVAIYRGRNKC